MGSLHFKSLVAASLLAVASAAGAQVFVFGEKTAEADAVTEFHPTHVDIPHEPLTERGQLDLVRNLEAEQGFAHRQLPMGQGLTLVANGHLTPAGDDYKHLLYSKGKAADPGDRVAITHLDFKPDRLILDINGGPYAKHRFLSHISINDMPIAQEGPIATGCRITLVFEGGFPEISAAEVKALLDPIIDFHARSAAEAYTNTLKPKVKEAVESHQILVGMDVRMVLASLGEPHTKHREHVTAGDPDSPFYEEWIYGQPPQATQFVRFRNGRVIRLEIAAIGKPIEIHDQVEIGPTDEDPTLRTRTIANGDAPISHDPENRNSTAPTLRRPGEVLETPNTMGRVNIPASSLPAGAQPASTTPPPASSSKQLAARSTL